MAGKPNRQDVEGYVHAVSPIKTPTSGNRYFEFKIQEREESRRVVCFSPDKRLQLKDNEENKSPVKLLSVSPTKRRYEPESTEYLMNNRSKVVRTKNIPFPWSKVLGEGEQLTVSQIMESSNNGDVVAVKAKVLWKGDNESVYSPSMRKTLNKCEVILADATGAIPATVWESMIPQLSEEISYVFQKFKVSFFNKKFLNGTPDSEVKEGEAVELSADICSAAIELKPIATETQRLSGRVLGVDLAFALACVNCKSKIAESSDQFVDCTSCKTTFIKEDLKQKVSANLVVVDDNGENKGRFHCSGTVLEGMFQSIKETKNYNIEDTDVTQLSRKMIIETLLLVKKVLFELAMDEMLIVRMEVSK